MMFIILILVLPKIFGQFAGGPYLMVEKAGETYLSKAVYITPMKCPANESENEYQNLQICLKEKTILEEKLEKANRSCAKLINETLYSILGILSNSVSILHFVNRIRCKNRLDIQIY